jgi:hypothetical protein
VCNGKNEGSLTDLTVGTWIVVQGTADSQGVITATTIYTLPPDAANLLPHVGQGHKMMGDRMNILNQVVSAVSSKLGMTTQDIMTQLKNGQTLAQIAQSKGVSQQDLANTIVSSVKDTVAQQVTAGNLTQAQADQINTYVQNNVDQIITSSPKDWMGNMGGLMGGSPGLGHGRIHISTEHSTAPGISS